MDSQLIKSFVAIFAIFTVFNGKALAEAESGDELSVKKAMHQLFETYNNGDLEGHINLFANDAIVLPPNGPSVFGKENIYKGKVSSMKKAEAVLNARIDEVVVSGDWAFVRMTGFGKIVLRDGTEIIPDDKAIIIWKRQENGEWLVTHDIWNSNLPLN